VIGNKSELYVPKDNRAYSNKYGYSIFAQVHADVYQYNSLSIRSGIGMLEKNNIYNSADIPSTQMQDSIFVYREFLSRYFMWNTDLRLKGNIEGLSMIHPYLFFGPSLQILQSKSDDINMDLQKLQLHGYVGFGMDLDIKKTHLFAEYQYYSNLQQDLARSEGASYKTKSYVVCVGIKYIPRSKN
jgi:hypothetical protein